MSRVYWLASSLLLLIVSGCASGNVVSPPQMQTGVGQQSTVPAKALDVNERTTSDLRITSYGPVHIFYASNYLEQHPELRPHGVNMTYHGGPILSTPKEYVLFWGRASNHVDPVHDPDNVWAYAYYFLKGAQGSPWLNTVTQYSQANGAHVSNPSNQLKSAWYDKHLPPNHITVNDIAKEAYALAKVAGYNPNADYIIMTPTGYRWPLYPKACGWHTHVQSNLGPLRFTLIGYSPDVSGCGRGSVNSPGIDDGVSIITGHEVAEAQTDPDANAWYGPSGISTEIGDKCAWRGLQNTGFRTGRFPTQPLWSNASSGCVQTY